MDEKWILAMDDDGRVGGYSLCDIFAEAHGLKRLSGGNWSGGCRYYDINSV